MSDNEQRDAAGADEQASEREGAASGEGARFGFVAIVGRTNVGKSTLLNRLVGEKLAIVSPVSQTTRHRILGVRNVGPHQLAFLDSPGFHKPQHRMGELLNETARGVAGEADVVALVVDAHEGFGPGDRHVIGELDPKNSRAPVVLVLNKVDLMNKGRLLPLIEEATSELGFREAVPVSAETGDNCERLLEVLVSLVPEGPAHFPPDYLTDQAERRYVAEIVREKLLLRLRQEVPHAVAVVIDAMDEREDGLLEIHAAILVERDSQKGIVIGARGAMLKQVGAAARRELEGHFERKVFLRLWVKVAEGWRDRLATLREVGVFPAG